MKRVLAFLALTLALAMPAHADHNGAFIRYYPAGGLTSPITTTPLDFSGVTNFTSVLKVYETSTHTGNNWIGFSYVGAAGVIEVGTGNVSVGAGAQGTIKADAFGGSLSGSYFGYSDDPGSYVAFIPVQTELGPDSGIITTGTIGNSLHLAEYADRTFNFKNGPCGTGACTDPTLLIQSHVQSLTESLAINAFGISGEATAVLSDANATYVFEFTVPSGSAAGFTANWTATATDTTDYQARRGSTYVAAVNKGGTVTCTAGDVGTPVAAVSSGTLTVAATCDPTGSNSVIFLLDANSSLASPTVSSKFNVNSDGIIKNRRAAPSDSLYTGLSDYWKLQEVASVSKKNAVPGRILTVSELGPGFDNVVGPLGQAVYSTSLSNRVGDAPGSVMSPWNNTNVSFGGWFKIVDAIDAGELMTLARLGEYDNATGNSVVLKFSYYESGGTTTLKSELKDGGADTCVVTTDGVLTGWQHIIWTYTKSTSTCDMWLNGVAKGPVTNAAVTTTPNFYDTDGSMLVEFLGAATDTAGGKAAQHLGFWTKKLSDAEIASLYNSAAGLPLY